jgi:hypothetical protein
MGRQGFPSASTPTGICTAPQHVFFRVLPSYPHDFQPIICKLADYTVRVTVMVSVRVKLLSLFVSNERLFPLSSLLVPFGGTFFPVQWDFFPSALELLSQGGGTFFPTPWDFLPKAVGLLSQHGRTFSQRSRKEETIGWSAQGICFCRTRQSLPPQARG